jgi:hypothetical protein
MTVIDNCGRWDWSLRVTDDGDVVARRPVKFDGATVFSTEQRPNSLRKASLYQLDAREVVKRYAHESETDRSVGDLLDRVQVALGGVVA